MAFGPRESSRGPSDVKGASLAVLLLLLIPLICAADPWPVLPTNISTPSQDASNPAIAVDPNGNVVAVWLENGVVKSNSTNVNSSWSATISTLSGSGASAPLVQIDQNGTATAIWVENGTIKSSSLPLNGSWSSAVAISGASSSSPGLAIDSSGNLVAVWVEGGVVQSATQPFGGSWSVTPDTLSGSGSSSPQIAIGNDGTVIAVWQGLVSSTPCIYAASKTISGSWSATSILSSSGINSCNPQIAIDPHGNALSIWYTYDLSGSIYSNVAVQSSSLPVGGSWSTPVILAGAGIRNPADLPLCVVAGPNGCYAAVWTASFDESTFAYEWSVFSEGSWSPSIPLINNNELAYNLDMSGNSNGNIFVIWMSYDSGTSSLIVQGALNDITSTSKMFFNPWTFSVSGNNAYPVVAMNFTAPNLYAAGAWVNFNGANNLIQALTLQYPVIQPPSNLSVTSGVTNYGVLTEIYNVLSWQASPSAKLLTYMIFRNGIAINWVSSNTLQYVDQNRIAGETVTYGVAATDSAGCQSPTVFITYTN